MRTSLKVCLIMLALALSLLSAQEKQKKNKGDKGGTRKLKTEAGIFPPELKSLSELSVILGRPTDKSITVSVLSVEAGEVYIEYGLIEEKYSSKTEVTIIAPNVPVEILLEKLEKNKKYYYSLQFKKSGEDLFALKMKNSFWTARSTGSTFTFALQGDSHPEREGKMYSDDLYIRTMNNVVKSGPDFYLTLGDDFSAERLIENNSLSQEAMNRVYAYQRPFLGIIGGSASLFLVNGNHEQAAKYLLDSSENNAAVLAGKARNIMFPLPVPDSFYSGDAKDVKYIGKLRDYYAWEWGDALFVVIDPYWHSDTAVDNTAGDKRQGKGTKKRDLWNNTLGEEQYKWFKKTLEESKAKYKFVFTHHVLGTGRGGIEQADLCEWGGKDKRGTFEFGNKRPGWELPIHQLMVKAGVTIFFQGHDHVYAHQELDGVVYQSMPNPADDTYTAFNKEAYLSGDVLSNSGHVRVTVSPAKVLVEYIRSWLDKDATNEHPNMEIAHSYSVTPKTKNDKY